jgi:hypothetical protein
MRHELEQRIDGKRADIKALEHKIANTKCITGFWSFLKACFTLGGSCRALDRLKDEMKQKKIVLQKEIDAL